MRRRLVGALIVALAAVGLFLAPPRHKANAPKGAPPGESLSFTVTIGGMERGYLVRVPETADRAPLPVVLVLHGGGGPLGTAELMRERSGWAEKAAAEKFLAVFPQGTLDDPSLPPNVNGELRGSPRNIRTWNEGSGRTSASARGIDDAGYIAAVLDDVGSRYPVDKNRIFATGFSNGASMSFRLGLELSDRIAAIAPVAGVSFMKRAGLKRPVSLLRVVGTEDRLPPGRAAGALLPAAFAQSSPDVFAEDPVEAWSAYLECPKPNAAEKDGVRTATYAPCRGGSEIVDVHILGMKHVYPGLSALFNEDAKIGDRVNATDLAWDFFQAHPRPDE